METVVNLIILRRSLRSLRIQDLVHGVCKVRIRVGAIAPGMIERHDSGYEPKST